MIEFLRRLFGQPGSSATAKERLRLVLMTDHLELAPEIIDGMKRDLVDVISRYVEVDRERIDVSFERQDSTLAMLANVPILSVNRPKADGSPKPAEPAAAAAETPEPAASANGERKEPSRKRRRRKKAHNAAASAPAVAPAPVAAN
ncbi:MAG: cell division topological specificity factor MinE [Candidatus Baltobacteraceae bacterium]